MKDLDGVIDDSYLIEKLNLTKGFINQHARSMGSFGKPRRFFVKHVMTHLEYLAQKSIQKANHKTIREASNKEEAHRLLDIAIEKVNRRKILKKL